MADAPMAPPNSVLQPSVTNALWLTISWLWVGVPLAWGVWQTIKSSLPLFR